MSIFSSEVSGYESLWGLKTTLKIATDMFFYEEGFVYLAAVIDILYTMQSAKKNPSTLFNLPCLA